MELSTARELIQLLAERSAAWQSLCAFEGALLLANPGFQKEVA
jgi:hypothetical protein